MPTSTSIAPRSSLGECVVCGKESSTRCSSCAQGREDWMFFCSREHQKLVWPMHKRVCGREFRWPPLTSMEQQEMIELSTKTVPKPDGGQARYIDAYAQGLVAAESKFGKVKDYTAYFKQDLSNLSKEEHPPEQRQRVQDRLLGYHSMIYSIRFDLGESNFGRIRKLIAAHPFTFLAYMETNFSPNITREGEWYSELQHRLVVLVSLLTFVHRSIELEDPEPFRAANNLVSHAMNRIKKLAQDVIRRSHEEEARLIVEVLLPNLLEHTDCFLRFSTYRSRTSAVDGTRNDTNSSGVA
ncbi:hypothetical protein JCM5353_001980 [Sporobolomyces roseus]